MNNNGWMMANVVWYDGSDAYVSKVILQTVDYGISEISKKKVQQYFDGNGEVLKIDLLYSVNFDNILALKDYTEQPELQAAFERFKTMWF